MLAAQAKIFIYIIIDYIATKKNTTTIIYISINNNSPEGGVLYISIRYNLLLERA
jgi:hypothetical protein